MICLIKIRICLAFVQLTQCTIAFRGAIKLNRLNPEPFAKLLAHTFSHAVANGNSQLMPAVQA